MLIVHYLKEFFSDQFVYLVFQVRLLSARASCTFITECVEEPKYKFFYDLYPGILEVMFSVKVCF